MGWDGERRKTYSVAVMDGIKRNRKTDSLNRDADIVVCWQGVRIEHVTERVQWIMGRGNGGTILVHIRTNNAD